MALSGIQIYKMLPQTNCKECGFPTCLAFSMKLAAKQVELSDCPHVTEESKKQLAESSAPPIRLITLKGKDAEVAVGNEVVLFRHEKKFVNRPGVLIRIADTDEKEAITEKVAAASAYVVDYVGLDLKLDGFAVEAAAGDAASFTAAVEAVRKSSNLPLILVSNDPAIVEAGLTALDGEKPLIMGANAENWEAMAALAKKAETALGVEAGSLEELAELTEKIQGAGVEDMVLHPTAKSMGTSLALQTQIRRLALKNFRPLGYPTIAYASGGGNPAKEATLAAHSVCKYAGFVVLDTFTPELAYSILVLRENIFTDPQKPIQVLPAIYEINQPKADDPVLVTTNFSITYFSVANEVEGSGLPAWLVVADAEGMSVLTAWAAGKFDAESIAKAVKQFGVADKVSKRVIVLPGHVAVLSGELEEELSDWEIRVGPREAVDLPAYMKSALT
ncbi:MAG: acetyl-CoA decarbonylase/synthase complex subunit gamma [Deltaproteobacteria bacterium]|jgi:acetyl-CoA decarbonylase/synthase complex subunit gamma|nr:acetyl-CoA decarbonylase/synthase complex subunit gamma [Deltaproteobacteria bacterium]